MQLLFFGHFAHQDAVFTDQTHQGNQTHLRINIHTRQPEAQHQQGAAHCHGHRHQNHQGIAQTFELRRKHQINNQQGEQEGHIQRRTFFDVLA